MTFTRRGMLAATGLGVAGPTLMRASDAMAQGVAPRRGGTLTTILQPEPPVLQIGVNNQGPTLIAAPKMFNGLLRFSQTLEPLPELAKSWTISPDGKEYVFRLQENVTLHDGRRDLLDHEVPHGTRAARAGHLPIDRRMHRARSAHGAHHAEARLPA